MRPSDSELARLNAHPIGCVPVCSVLLLRALEFADHEGHSSICLSVPPAFAWPWHWLRPSSQPPWGWIPSPKLRAKLTSQPAELVLVRVGSNTEMVGVRSGGMHAMHACVAHPLGEESCKAEHQRAVCARCIGLFIHLPLLHGIMAMGQGRRTSP